jgi:hypothetical protein
LLGATAAAGIASLLPASEKAAASLAPGIAAENSRPGTTDWQLSYVRPDRSSPYRTKLVEGYCSRTSVRPGETLDLFLSADPASAVTIDVYRMGYYGGAGGRHVTRLGPFDVSPQAVPEPGPNRLRECRWNKTTELRIPADWVSGVYLGKLSCAKHRYQSYVIFIVRDDRKADVMFQCSDTTWQAYNKWPANDSLYDADPPKALNGTTRVSFDRPYGKYPQVVDQPLSTGSGEFLCWEFPLCYWLEKQGYDVTYLSNLDTHADAKGLRRAKVLLSVGHDEYWSLEMFRNVKEAVREGLSVGFLSGNTCCFVAPLVAGSDARPARVFHRAGRYGGLLEAEKGQMGPFDLDARDVPNENTLIGARTVSPFNGSGDWAVAEGKAGHWLFEGTGMKEGESIPGLVGWEFHGDPAQEIKGLEVVATGPTINSGDKDATYTATVYPGPKGNWVFNAATIFWAMGLSAPPGVVPPHSHFGRPHGPDSRVQRMTANFLRKCGVPWPR